MERGELGGVVARPAVEVVEVDNDPFSSAARAAARHKPARGDADEVRAAGYRITSDEHKTRLRSFNIRDVRPRLADRKQHRGGGL